jgi:hypothetical protein
MAEDDSVAAEIFVDVFRVFSSGQENVYWLLYTYDSYTKRIHSFMKNTAPIWLIGSNHDATTIHHNRWYDSRLPNFHSSPD